MSAVVTALEWPMWAGGGAHPSVQRAGNPRGGVALGALLRSSTGAITVLAGVLPIVPGLTSPLPDSWSGTISPNLPSNAGSAVMSLTQPSDSPGPWTGLAVFAGWVAIALACAAYQLVRRDA